MRKIIKNYAGIFRHIMQKNMLIMRKTRWIMWKFKQFITLIIVFFHCFFSYLNCLVRFLLIRLFKFILTISLNYKMILWDNEWAKEGNVFKFPRASSSQVQFLINYCYYLKCQCFSSNRNQCKNKTSTQADRQKMHGTPGG